MIRRAQHHDIPFLLTIGKAAYPVYDERGARAWLNAVLKRPDILVLRGEASAGIAILNATFFDPTPFCVMAFLASLHPGWETWSVFRELVVWARGMGVVDFRFGTETGVDLLPFAKRLKLPIRDISRPYFKLDLTPWASSASSLDNAPLSAAQ